MGTQTLNCLSRAEKAPNASPCSISTSTVGPPQYREARSWARPCA